LLNPMTTVTIALNRERRWIQPNRPATKPHRTPGLRSQVRRQVR
jgi:hypothetical protein